LTGALVRFSAGAGLILAFAIGCGSAPEPMPAPAADPNPSGTGPARDEVVVIPPIAVEEEEAPAEREESPAPPETGSAPRGEGAAEPQPAEPPAVEPAPPPSSPLRDIPAGEIPAARFFEAVEAAGGGRVLPLEPDLGQVPIRLRSGIPAAEATVPRIDLILRAHGIYLAFAVDAGGKPVAFASRSKRPELPPSLAGDTMEIVSVRRAKPSELVEKLEAKLAAEKDRPAVTATASDRAGKVVVRGPSAERVAEIAGWLRKQDVPAPRAEGFGSYPCEFKRAVDVADAIVGRLSEEDRGRVQVVPHGESNTVIFRAPREMLDKLTELAREIDKTPAGR